MLNPAPIDDRQENVPLYLANNLCADPLFPTLVGKIRLVQYLLDDVILLLCP